MYVKLLVDKFNHVHKTFRAIFLIESITVVWLRNKYNNEFSMNNRYLCFCMNNRYLCSYWNHIETYLLNP